MSRHVPRKRFGQHFLRDRGVVERILRAFHPQPSDVVVEIGPGEGVLTGELIGRVQRLHVVELDRDLAARLRAQFPAAALTVHQHDALRFDFCALADGARLRLIGNLPYNISTPLLFHLLEQLNCGASASARAASAGKPQAAIADMLFMLQKEVVDRLAAAPGGKDYGRLSVMIQWRLAVEKLFDVGPNAFRPPPQVDSSVVRLVPHPLPPIDVRDPERFGDIVRAAFAHRRKTLRNNLKGLVSAEAFDTAGVDPNRRAETLSLQEFARLCRAP
jgi:16S rRNA (adenine1518-N6/adenine1519-N6)-dimethyltransferase